jgi:hypothetical protein
MNGLSLLLFGLRVRFVDTGTGYRDYLGWLAFRYQCLGLMSLLLIQIHGIGSMLDGQVSLSMFYKF